MTSRPFARTFRRITFSSSARVCAIAGDVIVAPASVRNVAASARESSFRMGCGSLFERHAASVSFPDHMADSLPTHTIDSLVEHLGSDLGGRVRRNEPLARYTTFRIGGPADAFVEVAKADELADAILAAR